MVAVFVADDTDPTNVILPVSSIVAEEFCMSLPVVVSKRAIALSVALAGHCTSPRVPVVPSTTHTAEPTVESVSS